VLLALLLPAVQQARAAARRTVCQSQLRQLGLAMAMYTNDHNGHFPRTSHVLDKSWVLTLSPYLEKVDSMRICPEDPLRAQRLEQGGTSYVLNEYLVREIDGPTGERVSVRRIDDLEATSQTLVTLEAAAGAAQVTVLYDHAHLSDWFSTKSVQKRRTWGKLLKEIQPDRHGPVSHYLFADGHVRAIPSEVLQNWALEGYNFGLPNRAIVPE
jgi:prepilin-type processing-associated H-X9-DG protein